MKIRYLRDHLDHKAGEISDNNLTVERLRYLVQVGVVEMIDENEYKEKSERGAYKEKAENKKDNVPTAKKAKKK